ncbi:hypothetical protein IC229_22780 [Spirosoma sp. BT702]|uniref:Uncharacterized protein n=1 Tax=Spirosoma profusum TaxID=2771354 RepID=A0A926Y3K5_9BACT|nr:hypothetical protein [Spirosoma profusum]MBD2703488.1 hypothetical protein [Spirosoma profusum]
MKTVLLFLLIIPFFAWAQRLQVSPDDLLRKQSYLLLRDGSVVYGRIVQQDSSVVKVRLRGGAISYVETDQIVRISASKVAPIKERIQRPSTVFVLKDGTRLPGTFVRQNNTMITVRKASGQLTYFEPELLLRVDTIRAGMLPSRDSVEQGWQEAGGASLAKPSFTNKFSPFMLTNPTAFNLEKGRFYYRNTLLLLNEIDYGITKNWSVGADFCPIINDLKFGSYSVMVASFRFKTKLAFQVSDQFRFGVNAIYQPKQRGDIVFTPEQVILQGVVSIGNSQRNATIGYGMRLLTNSISGSSSIYSSFYARKQTYISIGVMQKISRNLTLLSDNMIYKNLYFGGNGVDVSVALRLDRQRHAFDLGVLSTLQSYTYYSFSSSGTKLQANFYPYLAYNLLIGRH